MAMRTAGKGHSGLPPVVVGPCVPDATLKGNLDTLWLTGGSSSIVGYFIKFGTGANLQVVDVSDEDDLQGRIIQVRKTSDSYELTCEFYGYLDKAGAWHPAVRVISLPFGTTPALGDSIAHHDTDDIDSLSTGQGRVINVGATNADVII